MMPTPVIAIFDVGKTNKKLFLFNEDYKIVHEKSARFIETVDEDDFPCENLEALRSSLFDSLNEVYRNDDWDIKAINFSTYGASFVYIGENGEPVAPLYNYLKPYPHKLQAAFYNEYGGETKLARETASPVLGNLNSGMQLYRIKKQNPRLFRRIKYALHLPQYISYALTGKAFTDITSIGCHTGLWDFDRNQYHTWVDSEHLTAKFPPITPAGHVVHLTYAGHDVIAGIGLHDSSAALIPYLANFHEPFMLLSTGTWCISLNPFNNSPLTAEELGSDCLRYMDYNGKPVKASRLFSGHEHEKQTKRIDEFFNEDTINFKNASYNQEYVGLLKANPLMLGDKNDLISFDRADLSNYGSAIEAYHHLIYDLVKQQALSSNIVLNNTPVKRIFVDGGFSKNSIYMNMLAAKFPEMEVFAASMPQGTALGAALAIHKQWNSNVLPANLIELNYYAVNQLI